MSETIVYSRKRWLLESVLEGNVHIEKLLWGTDLTDDCVHVFGHVSMCVCYMQLVNRGRGPTVTSAAIVVIMQWRKLRWQWHSNDHHYEAMILWFNFYCWIIYEQLLPWLHWFSWRWCQFLLLLLLGVMGNQCCLPNREETVEFWWENLLELTFKFIFFIFAEKDTHVIEVEDCHSYHHSFWTIYHK